MGRPEPQNIIEFNARFAEAQKISGWGVDVTMHMPCPFCAKSDFLVGKVLAIEEALEKGAVCRGCGRGARAVFTRGNGTIRFEIVQTVGPDQPEWMEPKMRRFDKWADVATPHDFREDDQCSKCAMFKHEAEAVGAFDCLL